MYELQRSEKSYHPTSDVQQEIISDHVRPPSLLIVIGDLFNKIMSMKSVVVSQRDISW